MKEPKTKCSNILPALQHTILQRLQAEKCPIERVVIFYFLPRPGGGGGHPDPEIRGGNGLKKFFGHNEMALRASVWSKITGSATVLYLSKHES